MENNNLFKYSNVDCKHGWVENLTSDDVFNIDFFAFNEDISDFVSRKFCELFDNLTPNKKMAVFLDMFLERVGCDAWDYDRSELRNLVLDAEAATEGHFTQNVPGYEWAESVCFDTTYTIYLKIV